MPTPFPGMDPYLERRGLWEQIHANLIVDVQRFLTPLLRPRYHVAIEQRTYLAVLPPGEQRAGQPDVLVVSTLPREIGRTTAAVAPPVAGMVVGELPMPEEVLERYLEVRDVDTREVITVIEVLSPTNKATHSGRAQYERKRLKVLGSLTNLVEIDLIRAGEPFPMQVAGRGDYRIIVSRSQHRPQADIYLFGVRDPIPDFPIPLQPGEDEPILPLNQILHDLYDQGGYDLVINYQQSPTPPLSDEDARWAERILVTAWEL